MQRSPGLVFKFASAGKNLHKVEYYVSRVVAVLVRGPDVFRHILQPYPTGPFDCGSKGVLSLRRVSS